MKTVSCLFFASEDYNLTRFDSRMGDLLPVIPVEQFIQGAPTPHDGPPVPVVLAAQASSSTSPK
jgi:hypothetical protein